MQQNETMHHCLETVKLANRVCQKTQASLEKKLHDMDNMATFHNISTIFIETDIKILQSGKASFFLSAEERHVVVALSVCPSVCCLQCHSVACVTLSYSFGFFFRIF